MSKLQRDATPAEEMPSQGTAADAEAKHLSVPAVDACFVEESTDEALQSARDFIRWWQAFCRVRSLSIK